MDLRALIVTMSIASGLPQLAAAGDKNDLAPAPLPSASTVETTQVKREEIAPATGSAKAGRYPGLVDSTLGAMQYQIGHVYEQSVGDDAQGAQWYASAARHNDPDAQYRLGLMYSQGKGIRKDQAQAIRLLRAAAEQAHPDAQGVLGLAYFLGHGVRQDLALAYMWISLAVEAKPGPGARVRDMVASALPGERLSQARALVARCRARHYLGCDTER
jgi:hypothetical protein